MVETQILSGLPLCPQRDGGMILTVAPTRRNQLEPIRHKAGKVNCP